jgi:sugar O-acyltransferase (sialic acid O-acetyltransferase NeuD family)
MAPRRIVIVGAGEFAEIACEYFTHDSPYDVAGFAVESEYLTRSEIFGLPVVDFDTIEQRFPAAEHGVFVAVTYTQFNRLRRRLLAAAKAKGYQPVSYISSKAFVWRNAEIGENCFVFEGNVIQYSARIADNVVLWSGNHIGHRAVIGNDAFLSSHVVISGYCTVGEACFMGVNSCVADRVSVADDCLIGAGAVVLKNTERGKIYRGNPAEAAKIPSYTFFGIRDDR